MGTAIAGSARDQADQECPCHAVANPRTGSSHERLRRGWESMMSDPSGALIRSGAFTGTLPNPTTPARWVDTTQTRCRSGQAAVRRLDRPKWSRSDSSCILLTWRSEHFCRRTTSRRIDAAATPRPRRRMIGRPPFGLIVMLHGPSSGAADPDALLMVVSRARRSVPILNRRHRSCRRR